MVKQYRKKPVSIYALQYAGNNQEDICKFVGENSYMAGNRVIIKTLEGDMTCSIGDYVIKGINGEFYPCKPDIFEKTYELIG